MSKKHRNKWCHLSTLSHCISLRIRSPKSPGVHLGPLWKGFRTSDRIIIIQKMKQGNSDLRRFSLLRTLQVAFGNVVALYSLK